MTSGIRLEAPVAGGQLFRADRGIGNRYSPQLPDPVHDIHSSPFNRLGVIFMLDQNHIFQPTATTTALDVITKTLESQFRNRLTSSLHG